MHPVLHLRLLLRPAADGDPVVRNKQAMPEIGDLNDGIAGGSILTGVLHLGVDVEIRPGE